MVSLCCLCFLQQWEILFVNNPGWEFSLCNKKVNSSISSRLCPFDNKFHKDSDYHTLHSYIHHIVNSLVFSKLLYCSSVWAETHYGFLVWANTTKKNIELLHTMQNFAIRIVSGTRKFDHVTPILKQLQWLPIVKQLEVRDATMVFKCLNGLSPPYLCEKFKTRSEVHNCNTMNRDRLHIPLCRTAAGQRLSARLPSEAKGRGIVSQTSFSLSLIYMYLKLK